MPTGDGTSLGSALADLLSNYSASGTRSSYAAVSWHAKLVQLTGTARGRDVLGQEVDVTRRTFLGWLAEDVTPRASNRDAIDRAYERARGGVLPEAIKTAEIRISGEVNTGDDTRNRGDGSHAPLLVDAGTGRWDRIEELWAAGDVDPDELEELFIEDVVYEDPSLGEGSGGWGFPGSSYSVTA